MASEVWISGIVFVGWIVSLCLHEFGHAVVAYWGGDRSVKAKGYLTLNPLNYAHPLLSIGLPFLFLLIGGIPLPGGAVYIDESQLRGRFWRSLVAAAGPLASFLTAVILALPFRWGMAASTIPLFPNAYPFNLPDFNSLLGALNPSTFQDSVLLPALALLVTLNVYVGLFNLLPIPPLDGYGIVAPWLPPSLQHKLRDGGIVWLLILFGVLWLVPPVLLGLFILTSVVARILGVPLIWSMAGFMAFRGRPIALLFALFAGPVLVRFLVRHLRRPSDIWVNSLDVAGWVLLQVRQYPAALACYQRAVKLNPQAYGGIWCNLGMVLSQLQRYEAAIAAFDQGLAVDPDYSDEGLTLGSHQLWLNRGRALMQLNRDDEALASFQQGVARQPAFIDGWLMQIVVLQRLNRCEETLPICDRLLENSPVSSKHRLQLLLLKGEGLIGLKRYEEALAIFETCCQRFFQSPAGWHDCGVALAAMNRVDEALEAYGQALKRSPQHQISWVQKGWLLFTDQRYEAALDCCQQSKRWLPNDDVSMLNVQGAALSRLGRRNEAIAAYDRAIQLQPNHANSWYNRACVYVEADVETAIANLRHAIDLNARLAEQAKTDESFDAVRQHPAFQALFQ